MRIDIALRCIVLALHAPIVAVAQTPDLSNDAPRLSGARGWSVGPLLLRVGHQDDPSGIEFSRIVGMVRFSDGRIVVANAASSELIYLSADGRELKRAGRSGQGPGEFQMLGGLGTTPDGQLWASDPRQRVIHIYDPNGGLVRTVSHVQVPAVGPPSVMGVLGDGRFVLANMSVPLGGPAAGFDSTDVTVFHPATGQAVVIGRVPKIDTGDPTGSKIFGAPMVMAVGPREIWWGYGDRFQFHRLAPDGRRIGGFTMRHTPTPLTGQLWNRYLESRLAAGRAAGRTAEQLEQTRRQFEGMTRPPTLPAFTEVQFDATGHLWVREYELPGLIDPPWQVFDAAGAWITTLTMPARFRPMRIGADWILGVQRDEDGVESVAMYRLRKGAA